MAKTCMPKTLDNELLQWLLVNLHCLCWDGKILGIPYLLYFRCSLAARFYSRFDGCAHAMPTALRALKQATFFETTALFTSACTLLYFSQVWHKFDSGYETNALLSCLPLQCADIFQPYFIRGGK